MVSVEDDDEDGDDEDEERKVEEVVASRVMCSRWTVVSGGGHDRGRKRGRV
jgi:hypothetical protein